MVKWSISTINTLRRCNRQYYFAHIAAHHGRKDAFRREAYELKRMQNLKMWPGSVVDKFIEIEIIPNIDKLCAGDFVQLAEKAVEMAKTQFEFSKRGLFKDPSIRMGEVKSEFAILSIHKLSQNYSNNEITQIYEKVKSSILNFPSIWLSNYNSTLFEFLQQASWKLPNVMNWSFHVDNIRVSPQIDLLVFHENKPVIIDWKVSESNTSDYSRQLIVCGLTVLNWQKKKAIENRFQLPNMDDYTLMEVNLSGKGNVKYHDLTLDRANEIIDYINLTGTDLKLLIDDRKYSEIDIEEFDLTDKDTTCNFCNFRRLCEKAFIKNKICYEEKAHN